MMYVHVCVRVCDINIVHNGDKNDSTFIYDHITKRKVTSLPCR